jgi:FHA domain
MPALVIRVGPSAGERIEIVGQVELGRSSSPALQEDAEISRQHAVVRPAAGGLEIQDVGSSNGTFVNEERISGARTLSHGDRVRIGQTILEVDTQSAAPPAAAAPAAAAPGSDAEPTAPAQPVEPAGPPAGHPAGPPAEQPAAAAPGGPQQAWTPAGPPSGAAPPAGPPPGTPPPAAAPPPAGPPSGPPEPRPPQAPSEATRPMPPAAPAQPAAPQAPAPTGQPASYGTQPAYAPGPPTQPAGPATGRSGAVVGASIVLIVAALIGALYGAYAFLNNLQLLIDFFGEAPVTFLAFYLLLIPAIIMAVLQIIAAFLLFRLRGRGLGLTASIIALAIWAVEMAIAVIEGAGDLDFIVIPAALIANLLAVILLAASGRALAARRGS